VQARIGEFTLTPHHSMQPVLKPYDGQKVVMGIRAENMETLRTPADDALKVEVLVVEPLGSQNLLTVHIGNDIVKVATHPTFLVSPGMDVWLRFPADKIRWVERDSGRTLYP
jgi:multiple sugar transport system ATP-binding protein